MRRSHGKFCRLAVVLLAAVMLASSAGCTSKKKNKKVPTVDADTFMAQCEESLGWTRSYSQTCANGQYWYCNNRVELDPGQVSYLCGSDDSIFLLRIEYSDQAQAAEAFDSDYSNLLTSASVNGGHDEEYDYEKKDDSGYVVVHPNPDNMAFYYTLHVYFRNNVYVYMIVYGTDERALDKVEDLVDELDYPDL